MSIQKNRLFHKIKIGVVNPSKIQYWAQRYMPGETIGEVKTVGEVKSWETVNYKTLKPEPNGLFCQKIFGPLVDFTCACGKKSTQPKRKYCTKCGVERTYSRVRRYRLGYIKLKQPVVHPLYASPRPSPLSLCLNWSAKRIQAVMKTTEFCSLPYFFSCFPSRFETRIVYRLFKERRKKGFQQKRKNGFHQKRAPRLFSITTKPKAKSNCYTFNMGLSDLRLYGIAYDATWQHVEHFQEFLFYLWEHSFSYECGIMYYAFLKKAKDKKVELPPHDQAYPLQTGGFAFRRILVHLSLRDVARELLWHYKRLDGFKRYIYEIIYTLDLSFFEDRKRLKRLKIKLNRLNHLQLKCKRQIETFRDFDYAQMEPAWMILSYLPVLPPGLRPITSIRGELVVSDINSLYRKVIIRNKRISRGANFGFFDTALSGSWVSWCYNLRQVQEAVDELLKTGSIEGGRPLKSLLEGLKGKQGRFRQHLLGKRVDYSGRSVIVVGPELKLHQCGLPKQMAIELFQPFIIQKLRQTGIVVTTIAAKAVIAERKPIVWTILNEILKTHPILLNRAPTLHRLGIQAFLPQLVEGKAILLHPLVCPAFNADFDGDQMAVHVPLSGKAKAEALALLWSRNHLLAPASGQPLLLPTQDMVLGFYYLTCSQDKPSEKRKETFIPSGTALRENQLFTESIKNTCFPTFFEVKKAYDRGLLSLHTPIWIKWDNFVQTFTQKHQSQTQETLVETRLDIFGHRETLFLDTCHFWTATTSLDFRTPKVQYVRTTPGRVFMHSWIFEAPYSLTARSKRHSFTLS